MSLNAQDEEGDEHAKRKAQSALRSRQPRDFARDRQAAGSRHRAYFTILISHLASADFCLDETVL
jgi:hypothetical protein